MNTYRVPKINNIMMVGNLTADPEYHITKTTRAMVANFRIAWSEKFKTKDGQVRERACFINVSAWLKLAELCKKFLEKGDKVYVEGKLLTRSWTDKEGQQKQNLEILANRIEFLKMKDRHDDDEPVDETDDATDE